MKTIVEKMSELEFQSMGELVIENADIDEGLKDIWQSIKDKVSIFLHRVKNRIIMCFSDGTAIPAVSPLTSGLAINSGEAGASTFIAPVGQAYKRNGIKGASMSEIVADFAATKKSVCESLDPDKDYNAINEATASLNLSGQGKYGPDVTTDELKFYLKSAMKHGEKAAPLLIWGAPGIGKTQIVKAVLKECFNKKTLILKNLGQCQKDDFTLPAFDKDDNGKITAANEVPKTWLPMYRVTGDPQVDAAADNIANGATKEGEVGEGGVIFFDEIARCAPDVQAVALSLIEDRALVGYKLGSKWTIISASNRECDDPNMDISLSKALGNRFGQVNFVPVFDSWKEWADKHAYMNPEVVSFLQFNQKYWYLMHPDDDDEKIFASPRAWDKCCMTLCQLADGSEEDGFSLDDIPFSIIQKTLEQFVQPEVAVEFMTYYNLTRAIDIDALHNVFKAPKKAPNLKTGKGGKAIRADVKYYMVSKVLSGMDVNKYPEPEELKNLAEWLVTSEDESVAASALHTLFEMFKDLPFMIGNPACQNLPNHKNDWNKYIEFTNTLIQGIPALDKDLNVDM